MEEAVLEETVTKAAVAGEAVLKLTRLFYSYEGKNNALDGIDLTICSGEKIAVVGANGAGKSTFFLCLNGVLSCDQGTVEIRGKPVGKKNLRELRKLVGIVFQDADSQIIAPTVAAEISFGPMNLKLPISEVRERVNRSVAYMNLKGFEERPPHNLSGGEKKRVTIADIIAMEPEVLVFDEPATALDPVSQQMLEEVLDRLHREGKTLLISTHDVDFAYRFAERVLVFAGGRIIADGPPETVFDTDEVLSEAHLKRPVMLELYQLLLQKQFIKDRMEDGYPRTPSELEKLL